MQTDRYANDPELTEQEIKALDAESFSTTEFLKNIDNNKKDSMVPPRPNPGELMYCQMCKKPILPEHFSKDKRQRQFELKWHIHPECHKQIHFELDKLARIVRTKPKVEKPKEQRRYKSMVQMANKK